ncbi:unnamed protein product, partial [Meganyctiphanes norvegica]
LTNSQVLVCKTVIIKDACILPRGMLHSLSRSLDTWLTGMVLVLAMVANSMQGAQPQDCILYQVTHDQPIPTLVVPGNSSETLISLDLLFDNATASVNISDGGSFSSCQITVSKASNGTLEGNCFKEREIACKFNQVDGMNTIVLSRRGRLLMLQLYGDNSKTILLSLQVPNLDKSIQVQVNSDTIINTAFNCPTNCFHFTNAIIHSKENLILSALQVGVGEDGHATSVIKILHGETWNENMDYTFTYPYNGTKDDDGNEWKKFYAASEYNTLDSETFLGVTGSLIGTNVSTRVGTVPSLDTYITFESTDTLLWSICVQIKIKDSDGVAMRSDVTIEKVDMTTVNLENEKSTGVTVTEKTSASLTVNVTTECNGEDETTSESGAIAMSGTLFGSMTIKYVILGLGVVAALLLLWFIWVVIKKRKTSGSKDIGGLNDAYIKICKGGKCQYC